MGSDSSKSVTSTATSTPKSTDIPETEPVGANYKQSSPVGGGECTPKSVNEQEKPVPELEKSVLELEKLQLNLAKEFENPVLELEQSESESVLKPEIPLPVTDTPAKMTAMAGLEEQLREMLQCKICFDDKEKQKLLPCQHTICLDCLNRLVIKESKYKCPLCNREMLVPNGGFESLQESLITKQLAHLITPRDERRPPAPAARLSLLEGGAAATIARVDTPPIPSSGMDEIQRKLNLNIKKGNDTLALSQTKLKSYSSLLDDLEQTAERMKSSINNLMEQTIDKLMANASKKVSAIDDLTQKKRDELLAIICKLSDTNARTTRGIELLERRANGLHTNLRQSLLSEEVQNTQATLTDLEDLLATLDSVTGTFRVGDSVRLRMDEGLLNSDFLLSDLNHYSIGYIHQVDDDGDCAVVFPENSRWTGNISQLEKSATKHALPIIGDRVRVKSSVSEPHFKWGMVKSTSIGILSELKNTGPSKGRQVEVDFPEDHDWTGLFDELERVHVEPLKVGEKVWVARDVSEPARGWAGVTPNSEGTLLSVNGSDVEVNFAECNNWKGLLSELERVRLITVGDKVKVKRSVAEPKFAWGGVDHDDVGKVAKILNSSEHGQVAKIDFPNRLGLWQCLLEEIEIVSRHSGGEQPSRRRRRSSDLQCPTQ